MKETKYKIRSVNNATEWLLKIALSVAYSLMFTDFVISLPASGFYFFFMLALLIVVSEKKGDLTVINNVYKVEDWDNEGS